MQFDELVNKILEEQQASRVTSGSAEVKDLLKTGTVNPQRRGGAFYYDDPQPKTKYLPQPKPNKNEKLGYVLRTNRDKLVTPGSYSQYGVGQAATKAAWEDYLNPDLSQEERKKIFSDYYKQKKYLQLPTGTPIADIDTIQSIKYDRGKEQYVFGKERSFSRLKQIYDRLLKAYQTSGIRPPRISTPATVAGLAAANSMLLSELPPDLKNSFIARGGLGIKGKFEAIP